MFKGEGFEAIRIKESIKVKEKRLKRRGLSFRTQEYAFHLEKREKTKEQSEERMGTFEKHLRTCPNVAEEYK